MDTRGCSEVIYDYHTVVVPLGCGYTQVPPLHLLLSKGNMLKKTLTYKDFNGDEVSEDYFFHLSQAELVELELSHKGGLSESMKKIIADEDGKAIIAEFKKIILQAYGKRSDDGRRFIKNQELRDEFESSEAYSTLFMELVLNAGSAAEFINGIVPSGMDELTTRIAGAELKAVPETEPTTMTRAELEALDLDKFKELAPQIASGEVKIVE